jgi:hypothetical protein
MLAVDQENKQDRLTDPARPPMRLEAFEVDPWMDRMGALVYRHPRLTRALAGLEDRLLATRLADTPIAAPIWISGLARSGSTILLQVLAGHLDLASHTYRDFPPVLTPYLWNRYLELTPQKVEQPAERSHGDGIMVTSHSPEAFEEPIWMSFFEQLHDPAHSAVLDAATDNPEFERFIRNHIRKLLLVRGRPRYLAKANYNATRLEYLLKLFPDARFIVPVRDPARQIASLIKQDRLTAAAEARYPAVRRYLARAGHFEFGSIRRPIHCGEAAALDAILRLRQEGRETAAWAVQWASLYGLLQDRIAANPDLARAVLFVRYEDFCRTPEETLTGILKFCGLAPDPEMTADVARRIHAPTYYRPAFDSDELRAIRACVAPVAGALGYTD